MGFHSEEDVDAWYIAEKEKLDERFQNEIMADKEWMAKARERYENEFKKLIERYQHECEKFVK